ncbi:SBBP repeat-containing protein [Myxococcota bacterium]|nr:SBBP repeat-containing protein [Myxococcota bacterium]MBU1536711.1 SBBP repeat-containing protein [Myxococcota bacterium]
MVDIGEECDGTVIPESCETTGYYGGQISCNDDCKLNVVECSGRCGDGVINGTKACDGEDFAQQTCDSLGYHGGQLLCTDSCELDVSGCLGMCGDGIIQTPEQCDGEELNGATCASLGYYGGDLACLAPSSADPCTYDLTLCEEAGSCGDGVVQENVEECDLTSFNGATCLSLGGYTGTITCTDDCAIDLSECPICGDGIIQDLEGENCDGDNLDGTTCVSLGHTYGGTLLCNDCDFDESQCEGRCGDGIVQSSHAEVCDGTELDGATCSDVDMGFGQPACSDSCSLTVGTCFDVIQFGSPASDIAYGIAQDTSGNIIVAGTTSGDFSGYTNSGGSDVFVVKYDKSGVPLWSYQVGSTSNDSAAAVATDAAGNIFVVGTTGGGLGQQPSLGSSDGFLIKLTPAGSMSWLKLIGSTGTDNCKDLAIDGSGNVFVTGIVRGAMGGFPADAFGNAYVIKYNSGGILQWTRVWGSTGSDGASAIALAPGGEIFIAGGTDGDLGGTSSGYDDAFVSKLDASGTVLWTTQGAAADTTGSPTSRWT